MGDLPPETLRIQRERAQNAFLPLGPWRAPYPARTTLFRGHYQLLECRDSVSVSGPPGPSPGPWGMFLETSGPKRHLPHRPRDAIRASACVEAAEPEGQPRGLGWEQGGGASGHSCHVAADGPGLSPRDTGGTRDVSGGLNESMNMDEGNGGRQGDEVGEAWLPPCGRRSVLTAPGRCPHGDTRGAELPPHVPRLSRSGCGAGPRRAHFDQAPSYFKNFPKLGRLGGSVSYTSHSGFRLPS